MKTVVKGLVIICIVGWAVRNPGQVSTDINRLMGAGQSIVSSVANAGGSALSGVTGGLSGNSTPAPASTP